MELLLRADARTRELHDAFARREDVDGLGSLEVTALHERGARAGHHERSRRDASVLEIVHARPGERPRLGRVRRHERGSRDELAPHRAERALVEEPRAAARREHHGIDDDGNALLPRLLGELRRGAHVGLAPERANLDRADTLIGEDDARLLEERARLDRHDAPEASRRLHGVHGRDRARERAGRVDRARVREDPRAAARIEPSESEHADARHESGISASMRPRTLVCCACLWACESTEAPRADAPYAPPPESCAEVDLDAPTAFVPCSTGSGVFGRWVVDEAGLPAYDYGLDENADARASWFNTEGLDRRDHWFSFGNSRVTALATNDGPIEVTTQDRGITYLDKIDASQKNFGGGFSYLDDGEATWSSAYAWRPSGATTTRRFGMGYARSSTEFRGVKVTRTTLAPAGEADAPAVIDEVVLENDASSPKHLRHYEVWDVARRPIETNWLVSGLPLTSLPASVRAARDARNGMFDEDVTLDAQSGVLGMRRTYVASDPRPAEGDPSAFDAYPGDPYLAALVAPIDAVYTDQDVFFGAGGPSAPDAVSARLAGDGATLPKRSGLGQPRVFVVRSDIDLAPGESRTLRFAYGYAPMGAAFDVQPAWRDPQRDLLEDVRRDLAVHLPYFAARHDGPIGGGALQREMAWHASQLEASVSYRAYWDRHVVPQGSAYLYLHGADGALRDLALFAIPLVYTHASLAREELLAMTGMQYAQDGRFSYAFQGHGVLDDALGIHAQPSDLDLFFLWSIAEYVGATGDALFDATAPFWPKEAKPSAIVWDHVVASARHLFDVVGSGPHGLVRVGDGDWNDGIVFSAPDRALAIASGESVPNTQMAVAVLPRVANLIESRDATLAAEIRAHVDAWRAALPQTWNGSYFGRAYFGTDDLFHASVVDLESQVWGLIGGTAPDAKGLASVVGSTLDDPSPTGAMLAPGGQVWPAISGLLTWGYALADPPRAWSHLAKNTMAAHALAFPTIWYGIWSGPDGLDSSTGDRPGEAWYSPATPMTDFPVQNANQHAMPILALLRTCGVEASASGVVIDPHAPGDFSLATSLLDVSRRGQVIAGFYRPTTTPRTIEVRAPSGHAILGATMNGDPIAVPAGATSVTLTASVASTSFTVMTSY